MRKFDKQDRTILELLQHDATLSVAEIAERIFISKSACWRRIQSLQDDGIITQKVTLLDQKKINLSTTAYVIVKTNQHNEIWAKRFKEIVEDIPEVLEVYRMSGDIDYLIKAVVPNLDGYDRLY